ncbi:hypothetical protein J5J10_00900 [Ciceribacter sp. L1K23]|uniref:hypothetical protein n=1 Tax=Ciceribacter sp. L1K23 TaxID=2820276 RepID=UPI001B812A15|nr:hypothetical protein [Ciceribacter sp. L1K23]MBR0554230.1 hypothetical protein [Ciceribacter sp. L1K23]
MTSINAVGNAAISPTFKPATANDFDTWFQDVLQGYANNGGAPDSNLIYDESSEDGLYGDTADPLVQDRRDQFAEWVNMSLAEKLRAQYLVANGLTEESLEAMPPEERKAIEDAITEYIEEEMKRQAGADGRRPDTDPVADFVATNATDV